MAVFNTLIEDMITQLKNESSLSDIDFKEFYENSPKLNPLKNVTVVFGFGSVKINNCALNDYLGSNSSGQLYSKETNFSVDFKIYTPQSMDASEGIEALDKLCEVILFKNSITKKSVSIDANRQNYDFKNFSFVINGCIKFKFAVSKEDEEAAISNIIVKGVY